MRIKAKTRTGLPLAGPVFVVVGASVLYRAQRLIEDVQWVAAQQRGDRAPGRARRGCAMPNPRCAATRSRAAR